ncbi:hypothetical protein CPK_ORF00875 [Chlamydia pneumoniae LPCoLN]|nr:hypothetical protein CPK_ORF00875 [Chlamydia pneumoniae LPCoLN]
MVLVIKYLFKGKIVERLYLNLLFFTKNFIKIFFFDNKDFYKFFLISLVLMS